MYLHKRFNSFILFHPYVYTVFVSLFTAILTFPGFVGNIVALPLKYVLPSLPSLAHPEIELSFGLLASSALPVHCDPFLLVAREATE